MRIAHLLAGLVLIAAPGLARADANPWDGGDPAAGKPILTTGTASLPWATCPPPGLWGGAARHSATIADFNYSDAMKAYNHVWTPENLFVYLEAPMKVVPG